MYRIYLKQYEMHASAKSKPVDRGRQLTLIVDSALSPRCFQSLSSADAAHLDLIWQPPSSQHNHSFRRNAFTLPAE